MAGVIDFYSESNQSFFIGTFAVGSNGAGQSFIAKDRTVGSVQFYLAKTGAPTGNATSSIYNHSGTFGTSSIPTGAALATSDSFDISTVASSFGLYTLTFSGANQIKLVSGVTYVITFENTNTDASNNISVGTDNTSPTHAGNLSTLTSGTWSATAGTDVCFYLYDNGINPTFRVKSLRPAIFKPGLAR